jgi:hypothetical protein
MDDILDEPEPEQAAQEPAAVEAEEPKQRTAPTLASVLGAVFLGFFIFVLVMCNIPWPHNHRKSNEAALKGDLQQLRNAIEQFQRDTGVYPATLDDLVAPDEKSLKTKVKPGSYKGPYFATVGGIRNHGLPINPFADPVTDPVVAHHWQYNPDSGDVTVPDSMAKQTTMDDDVPYGKL